MYLIIYNRVGKVPLALVLSLSLYFVSRFEFMCVCLISVLPFVMFGPLSAPVLFILMIPFSLSVCVSASLLPASSPSHRALQRVYGGNRTLMLTRSSFPGVGKYSGHWLGDNAANWNDIKWAIPGMLEFGLFGIPYVSNKHSQKGKCCLY